MNASKKQKSLFFYLISLCLIFGNIECKKEISGEKQTKSPFILKYEITSSEKMSSTVGTGLSVYFTTSNGTISNSLYNTNLPWVNEETVTESTRPFQVKMKTDGIVLDNPGYVTGNIFINGVKKASFTSVTSKNTAIGGYNIAYLDAFYNIN